MRRQISPDELNAIFRLIGNGVWQLQNVEDALQTLLTMREIGEPGIVSQAEAESILAKSRRHTLDTALRLLAQSDAVPADLLGHLRQWKEQRDWLIHRSVHECRFDMYTDEGREALFRRLSSFAEDGMKLQRVVFEIIAALSAEKGVDPEKANALARRQIAALKGEA